MKFLVTSGRKKGLTFELVEAEIKIGRRKDNDVILDDESISGYHAHLGLEGNRVFVEDCDSINGIELNGKLVKKTFLQKGDVVTIGMTQITVVGDDNEEDAIPPSEGGAEPSKAGRGAIHRAAPSSFVIFKKALAALLILAVIAVAWFLYHRTPTRLVEAGRGPSPASMVGEIFRLFYEKVQASNQNIFRYEMRIENGSLIIAIDDLKQGRQLRRNKLVEPSQIAAIRDAIAEQQIFSLPSLTEGKAQDVWDSYTLHVVMGGQVHSIRVLNRVLPDNFKKVCSILEDFGQTELGMVAISMPVEELVKRADDACRRARKLYDERFVKVDNLFNSIKAYSEVIWYLDSVEPKPPAFANAVHGKQMASDELDEQIKDHQFEAARARQLKDWKKAREALSLILQKAPDPSDKRYQDARTLLLDVEKRLQP